MFEKFAEDVMTRYQEKMAELLSYTEKTAKPKLDTYIRAARKRLANAQAIKNSLDMDNAFDIAQVLSKNIGAKGSRRLDNATEGFSRALRNHNLHNLSDLVSSNVIKNNKSEIFNIAHESQPDLSYLSRLTGIKGFSPLLSILMNPSKYVNNYRE